MLMLLVLILIQFVVTPYKTWVMCTNLYFLLWNLGSILIQIDVALCRLDNALYVRKAQPRRQALQATRERDVLLRARRTESVWSPHLLCAFKEGTGCGYDSSDGPLSYTLVMSYVPGGTLEDVLESCTVGGLAESDVRWWFSQAVCAIGWLHDQGWAHRYV